MTVRIPRQTCFFDKRWRGSKRPERLLSELLSHPRSLEHAHNVKKIKGSGKEFYKLRFGDSRLFSRIPKTPKTAPWLMLSADAEKIRYAAENYGWNSKVSPVINKPFEQYKLEGIVAMPYTMEDYQKDFKERFIKSLSKEDINHLLKRLKTEEVLKQYSPEEIEAYLKKVKK